MVQSDIKDVTEIPVCKTKMEKASYLIKAYLAQGDMGANEIYEKLSEAGVGHKTAESARKILGIKCYRKMRKWYWSLNNSKVLINKEGEDES